jgi:hypothetical protein
MKFWAQHLSRRPTAAGALRALLLLLLSCASLFFFCAPAESAAVACAPPRVCADLPAETGAAIGGGDSGWLEVRPGEVSLEMVGTQAAEEQH